MLIYRLRHIYDKPDYAVASPTVIGYFSSIEKVNLTISTYQNLPGYNEYPYGFIIEPCNTSFQNLTDTIYELSYSYCSEFGFEYCGELGIFKTEEQAEQVLSRHEEINEDNILKSPLSKEFEINEFEIDQCYGQNAFLD